MPTIDIPDKICPHCGGNGKWRVYHKKNGTKEYRCYNENGCVPLRNQKALQTHRDNKHRWPSQTPENHAAYWRKLYHENPIYKERQRVYHNKSSQTLDDTYIKKYMRSLIGKSLDELTKDKIIKLRKYLKTFRQLKQLENERKSKIS